MGVEDALRDVGRGCCLCGCWKAMFLADYAMIAASQMIGAVRRGSEHDGDAPEVEVGVDSKTRSIRRYVGTKWRCCQVADGSCMHEGIVGPDDDLVTLSLAEAAVPE